ncbi:MAG: AsmA-like C-terminal region-containing protein [Methylacidiphilales bacterium]|nr:AsmA-like C-terminal region-containing protein [Candidatus Methylacidiphilales bacterium]
MSSFRWIIITVAVVVVLLIAAIAVGGVWLNSFIHSPAFLAEVEARAGQSLGGTVQIKSIDFDIVHGVKLNGLVTQIGLSGGAGNLQANVATVSCAIDWSELFSRRLKFTGVTLDQPQIVLSKQPAAPLSTPDTTTSPENPAASGGGSGAGGGISAAAFQFVLDHAQISNGSVALQDAGGASLVNLQGVNVSADTAGLLTGQDVTGTVKVANAALPPGFTVTNFSTPFTYHPGSVTAKPLAASAFDGNLAGDYNLVLYSGPSILNLNGKGLDVAKLLTALSPTSSTATLTGSLDIQSKWRAIEQGAVDGEGDLQLANGQLHGVQILNDIAGLLKINELNDPVISQGQTHFQIANRQTRLTSLQLVSKGFTITGGGVVGFDGGLNLNLVLTLSKDAMGRLPQQVAGSFVAQPDGTGTIGFNVTGTTSNPQTDLPQRLLMQNTQIKNVLNKALNKFFH